jgi:AcrR family transcriptional regulator
MKKIKIDTKTKIANSAKKLFNEQETLSVTTNHIAKETGISPGNLY